METLVRGTRAASPQAITPGCPWRSDIQEGLDNVEKKRSGTIEVFRVEITSTSAA